MEKSTVTVSVCKILQSLTVTVDFFHLQSTFFTGAASYSRLFVTVSVVHLPHFVKCITIPITLGWATEINRGGATENRKAVFNHPGGVNENRKADFIHPGGVTEIEPS